MEPGLFKEKYFSGLKKITYLASCSIAALPDVVTSSLSNMAACMMSVKLAWNFFEEEVDEFRRNIATLIGAQVEQIAILPNASIGAFQIASTLNWKKRLGLIYTNDEFHSIASVWLSQQVNGAKPNLINTLMAKENIVNLFKEQLNSTIRLVSVPYSSFIDGRNLPLKGIIDESHLVGAKVFVDAYHALGIQPINVTELDCDYLVGGSMKYLLGLPGVAFLYIKDYESIDQLPQLTGWFARKDPFDYDIFKLDFVNTARGLETGTPSIPSIYAANAALKLIANLDLHKVRKHIVYLTTLAAQNLIKQGEEILKIPHGNTHGSHILLIEHNKLDLIKYLEAHSIVVSSIPQGIRISFHYYNTRDDVEYLCKVLQQYRSQKHTKSN